MADGSKDPFDFPDDPLDGVDGLNAAPFDSDNPTPSFPPPNFPPSASPHSPGLGPDPLNQPLPTQSASPNFPPPEGFGQSAMPTPPPGMNPPAGSGATPYYGAGAGPGFPPPAEQKKKRGCLFWAIIGFVAFVVLVGGCSIAAYLLVRGPIDATNKFLAEVEAGNYAGAAALAPAGCALDPTQVEADFVGLTSYSILIANTATGVGTQTGGTVTIEGNSVPFATQMEKNASDEWAVCSYSFNELEIGN